MKHRPGNAADRSSLHIGGKVVDKKAFFRAQAEALQGKAVNFRLGLHQSFVGRDKSSVKVTAAADPGPVFVLAEAGVGKQVNPVAGFLQLPDQLLHALHRQQRLVPVLDQGLHGPMKAPGNSGADALHRLVLRHGAPVHPGPFQGQKHLVHQKLPVRLFQLQPVQEKLPVKPDQHAAHVKNQITYHQTIFTFPFVARNTMSREIMVVTVRMVARAPAVPSLIRVTS